ncbi:MAG: asparagine synthase (glutamine-hydrolyzing) [Deltaproteobacteria bacterium]|nr:asparagine synthase (glutamine-hydrolyzing) [Deltaproteobacteria bacterium]
MEAHRRIVCGICGKLDFRGGAVSPALIEKMSNTLVHRGPDDAGVYTAPFIGLGQRRLSIIDLRPSATAPLSNEDGTVWVVFNGEIYNYRELRAALREQGHAFRTESDTEVIVHLYEEHGTACVTKMRGMFAFAVWDAPRKLLFCARDRFGKKPFCYARTERAFVFGSEIKAILADPDVHVLPDYGAIDSYLALQYVPSPQTAFKGIKKLPPAHFLTCTANGDVRVERYWEPPAFRAPIRADPVEIESEIVRRLREAVRARLISDVPLGAFLSGGIDSAAVVALMAAEGGAPVKTFSIGIDDAANNEVPFARLIAERYQTEHHELMVTAGIKDLLPKLVWHYNEPFADSSAIPTYYVAEMTRRNVTVALSGDGGDEVFGGYASYGNTLAWGAADIVPRGLRRPLGFGMSRILDRLPYSNLGSRVSRGVALLAADVNERFVQSTQVFKPSERRTLYTPEFKTRLAECNDRTVTALPYRADDDALDWMMRHDQHYYLPDCLMTKVDIAAMANSLEVRCPFLDHAFVEFAATIPPRLKRDATGGKAILRRALASLLPDATLTRKKTGFGIPLAAWLRSPLLPMMKETLLGERCLRRGLFERRFLERMVAEHASGARDWSTRLWALLFLELWFQMWIDRRG